MGPFWGEPSAKMGPSSRLKGPTMLDAGTVAPDFTLPDHLARPVTLHQERGHWVLLWWYPKAATPG